MGLLIKMFTSGRKEMISRANEDVSSIGRRLIRLQENGHHPELKSHIVRKNWTDSSDWIEYDEIHYIGWFAEIHVDGYGHRSTGVSNTITGALDEAEHIIETHSK